MTFDSNFHQKAQEASIPEQTSHLNLTALAGPHSHPGHDSPIRMVADKETPIPISELLSALRRPGGKGSDKWRDPQEALPLVKELKDKYGQE